MTRAASTRAPSPATAARATIYFDHIATDFGPMLVAGRRRQLTAIKYHASKSRVADTLAALDEETQGHYRFERGTTDVAPLAEQVREFLAGTRGSFDVELDLSYVKGFRRDVLLLTAQIPRGHVVTYAELARRAGSPRAFRAVGHAMATNPIPLAIPCHRVIGSNGSLHGYGGGLDMKRRLLAIEGAAI
jgi:methylated-DNA-[protein]-cysteine S-methyltransferase